MINIKQIIIERIPEITTISILTFAIYWTYTSLAWQTILKKLKAKNLWLAWIPFGRKGLILHTTKKFSWKWMFALIIPIIGWIYVEIITKWAIWIAFKKRKYPGWIILIPLTTWIPFNSQIPYYISMGIFLTLLGIIAWNDKK